MFARARLLLTTVAAVVLTAWCWPAHGQSLDLASLGAQYMPSAEMGGAPGSVQVSSCDVAVNAPLPVAPKTIVVPGATYDVDAVSVADTAPEFVQLRAFQSVDLSTLMAKALEADLAALDVASWSASGAEAWWNEHRGSL